MCVPLLAAAPAVAGGMTGMQMLSLGMTGLSTITGAMGANQAAKSQAKIAEHNAQVKDNAAKDAAKRGQEAVHRKQLEAGQLRGQQRAAIGASGVELSGSPLNIILDSAMLADLDAQTIARNYKRESDGIAEEAAGYRGEASAHRARGKREAFATLLTGGGTLLDKYGQFS